MVCAPGPKIVRAQMHIMPAYFLSWKGKGTKSLCSPPLKHQANTEILQCLSDCESGNTLLIQHLWSILCIWALPPCLSPLNLVGHKFVIIYLCYWYQWLLSIDLHFSKPQFLFLNQRNRQYTRHVPLCFLKNIIYIKLSASARRHLDTGFFNQSDNAQYIINCLCSNISCLSNAWIASSWPGYEKWFWRVFFWGERVRFMKTN